MSAPDKPSLLFRPELVSATAWIAPGAVVTAHVELAAGASVWFGAVLRGDSDVIRVGLDSNIQDQCCLHADPGFPCEIGQRVTIGHAAVVHGALIEDDCLIGIKAVILTGAKIGRNSIVGAGAVVREGQVVPENSVVVGIPAKVVRQTSESDSQRIQRGAKHYVENAARYRQAISEENQAR